jgi:glycosyltransferase involved in cell wall biosynthesis
MLVVEAMRDGVFNQVRNLIAEAHRQRPEMVLDVCYSSHHADATFPSIASEIERRGGAVYDLKVGNAPSMGDIRAMQTLCKAVQARRPEVIHAHSSKAGGLSRLAGMFGAFPPVLYTPHAYFGMGGATPKHKVFNWVESALGRRGISTNCSLDERRFALETLRIPPRRTVLLYHGIELDRFSPATPEGKVALRAELGLPPNSRLLISVGRDSYQKNYAPLYRALDRFAGDASERFHFAHAGAGAAGLAASLDKRAQAAVTTWEHLRDIAPLVRAADGFIMTSRYEGLSIAMLETLASGVRMFLTLVPGTRCLSEMRFDEISWIAPDEGRDLEGAILSRLREFDSAPILEPCSGHVKRARELFDRATQFSKLFRLYDHLASR